MAQIAIVLTRTYAYKKCIRYIIYIFYKLTVSLPFLVAIVVVFLASFQQSQALLEHLQGYLWVKKTIVAFMVWCQLSQSQSIGKTYQMNLGRSSLNRLAFVPVGEPSLNNDPIAEPCINKEVIPYAEPIKNKRKFCLDEWRKWYIHSQLCLDKILLGSVLCGDGYFHIKDAKDQLPETLLGCTEIAVGLSFIYDGFTGHLPFDLDEKIKIEKDVIYIGAGLGFTGYRLVNSGIKVINLKKEFQELKVLKDTSAKAREGYELQIKSCKKDLTQKEAQVDILSRQSLEARGALRKNNKVLADLEEKFTHTNLNLKDCQDNLDKLNEICPNIEVCPLDEFYKNN